MRETPLPEEIAVEVRAAEAPAAAPAADSRGPDAAPDAGRSGSLVPGVRVGAIAGAVAGGLRGLHRGWAVGGSDAIAVAYFVLTSAFVGALVGCGAGAVWALYGRPALRRLPRPRNAEEDAARGTLLRSTLLGAAVGAVLGNFVAMATSGGLTALGLCALAGAVVGLGWPAGKRGARPGEAPGPALTKPRHQVPPLPLSALEACWEGERSDRVDPRVIQVGDGDAGALAWAVTACPWWLDAYREENRLNLRVRNCGRFGGRVVLSGSSGSAVVVVSSHVYPEPGAAHRAAWVSLASVGLGMLAGPVCLVAPPLAPGLGLGAWILWSVCIGGEALAVRSLLGCLAASAIVSALWVVAPLYILAAGPPVWAFVVGGSWLLGRVVPVLLGAGVVAAAIAAGVGFALNALARDFMQAGEGWIAILVVAGVFSLVMTAVFLTAMGVFLTPCTGRGRAHVHCHRRFVFDGLAFVAGLARRAYARLLGLLRV